MDRLAIVFFSLFLCAGQVLAQTSLWKVVSGDRVLYLGGSVHALPASAYPLPAPFEAAYKQADQVVLETDRGMTMTRSRRNSLLRWVVYKGDRTLQDVVKPSTWTRLVAHMKSNDIPIDRIWRFKPGMVTVVLPTLQNPAGDMVEGVDHHLVERARLDGKSIGSLELLFDQMKFFSTFGQDDPDRMVLHAIGEASRIAGKKDQLTRAWQGGDTDWIAKNELIHLQKEPDIYRALVTDRNMAWLQSLKTMIASEPVELVLVGVLHLAGPDSLIGLLRQAGYQVEQQ